MRTSLLRGAVVAGVASGALALAGSGHGPVGAQASAAPACPRVVVLGIRGSGQKWGYGQPVWDVVNNVLPEMGTDRVVKEPIDYPSVSVTKLGILNGIGAVTHLSGPGLGAYHDSVVKGKAALLGAVRSWTSRCSTGVTKIVLVGYSQGAQAAGDVFQSYGDDSAFGGVVLFGDPYFNPDSPGDVAGSGFSRRRHGLLGTRAPFNARSAGMIRSYCHGGDPICQGLPTRGSGPHGTYNTTGEAADAGRWLSTRLRAWIASHPVAVRSTPAPVAPPPVAAPAPTWAETTGGVARTWTDPSSAGGVLGPSIAGGQTVRIACRLQGFRVADGNTWWYRIASAPWSGRYYVSADAFYNDGATSGSLHGTPFVDPAVGAC
jgi:hypothetical protein